MYLDGNQLTGKIPDSLGSLPNLEVLSLAENGLTGTIPPSLGNLSSLSQINLQQNNLEGAIPDGLAGLRNLESVSLYQNRLSGTMPPSFYNSTSLYYLSIANNDIHGRLPPDLGNNLPKLQYILLFGNRLTGTIPASLANATTIQELGLANNTFRGQVPAELGRLCPVYLEMSNNALVARNTESWAFLSSLKNCSRLLRVALDGNKLGGMLPSSVANLSHQLQELNLGGNQISGAIPPGIANLVGLQVLVLESNRLTGKIPVGIGKLQNLQELWLGENYLSGPVPSSLGNLTGLLELVLRKNRLDGSIPASLGKLQQLALLDLSSNALTGSVPEQVFSLSSLSLALNLSSNCLVGSLPPEIGQLQHVTSLVLSQNNFSGEIPDVLSNCQSLEYLALDNNIFSGSIPPSLSNLKGLRRLSLAENNLSGSIPQQLCQMTGLQELYLSRNDLSGAIPELLGNLTSLIALDLSFNHLEGQVPSRGVFTNMSGGLSLIGNDGLCGGISELHLASCPDKSVEHDRRRCHLLFKIVIPIASMVLCVILVLLAFYLLNWRTRQGKMNAADLSFLEDTYPRVSYAELVKATDGFAPANLIGKGKYGSVYQGSLSLKKKGTSVAECVVVAVKLFNLHQIGSSKSFIAECEALRRIRHRNLISIITCCSSADANGNNLKALVFDFMPNFSLDRWLHPRADQCHQTDELSLTRRLNIAVEVADALDYLHNNCQQPIVHCDLKPSNILLDDDLTVRVGDFGLAKLLLDSENKTLITSESSMGIRGTIGYVAPEYGTSGEVSTFGDVYSFGIVLLEIVTGKTPTDDMFKDGLTLHQFVQTAFPEKILQIVDPVLFQIKRDVVIGGSSESIVDRKIHDCLVSVMRVGLSCSKLVPSERMSMKAVATEMHVIRDAYLGGSTL